MSWPFRGNRLTKLPGRVVGFGALATRALTWPVRQRRLPSRAQARLFATSVAELLPAGLRRYLQPPAPPEPVIAPAPPPGPEPFVLPPRTDPYQVWIEHNTPRREEILALRDQVLAHRYQPFFSIVMPVYNVPQQWLDKALESVVGQLYPNWELCIADDGSTDPHVRSLLRRWVVRDGRIKVRYLPRNVNISAATNAAAELATGEFLVLMDQDDEITPDCLLELAQAVQQHPDSDVLYSDDDKIDVNGRRYHPQFKPDWSPELLLAYMYLSHVFAIRRGLFEKVGGCRTGFEGCQDYDLALRVTEQARRITHIPRVLYHWRCLPGSTADSGGAKPAAFERSIRAVQEALDRRGIVGTVSHPEWAQACQCGIFQIDFPDTGPKVSIIIPTRNGLDLLRRCLDSILQQTTYENYEILVIDNDSDDPEALEYLAGLSGRCRAVRMSCPGGRFSYAWLNNEAVRCVDGEYVLFLNNDTEVRRPDWLSQMVGYAGLKGVGAVGARLLFPDGRIQHAGVVTGLYHGMAGPAFKLTPGYDAGYLAYSMVSRNYSAVTAACLLMPRNLFLEVGGFDAERFAVAYNDVDLCLRLRERGYRCVFSPRTELNHHEGASRGFGDNPREVRAFRQAWGHDRDPYYNPNLCLDAENYAISTRRNRPWLTRTGTRPVRVLMCSHNLNHEGAPNSLFQLAVGLKRRGRISPEVYSPQDGPLRQRYRDAGIPVHVLTHPLAELPAQRGAFEARTRQFALWMQQQGYELVYANTLETYFAIHGAHIARLPSVWNVRESADWRTYYERHGEYHVKPGLDAFSLPYRVIFVANATRALYEELNTRHNFSVIHNGLDLTGIKSFQDSQSPEAARRWMGCPPDKTVFTIVGTVCERKGQQEFARAAIELLRRGRRDVFFFIVGCRPGPYQEQLEQLLAPYREHFGLVPETGEVFQYLRGSDVFVCCSNNESYPRVTLEAMAFGLPIVTTPVFGIAEQVTDKVSALTYTPGDWATLTTHMERLAQDGKERTRLGGNARIALESLTSYEEMLMAYETLFLEAFETGREFLTDAVLGSASASSNRRAA